MSNNKFFLLEIIGVFFIFICACLLHFVYGWTNGSLVGVLFGSVNESVWEHLKIFALPYVVWSIIELAFSIPYFRQFVVVKTFGLYLLCGLIVVFFYILTDIAGKPILWLDILSSFLWICVVQFFTYKLTASELELRWLFPFALGLLFLFAMMYFCFTAVPPHIPLFKDPLTGMYGIIPENIDVGAFFMSSV
ncbi:MAG: DUF6512 family protein [Acutalibacteraceae bacterium]